MESLFASPLPKPVQCSPSSGLPPLWFSAVLKLYHNETQTFFGSHLKLLRFLFFFCHSWSILTDHCFPGCFCSLVNSQVLNNALRCSSVNDNYDKNSDKIWQFFFLCRICHFYANRHHCWTWRYLKIHILFIYKILDLSINLFDISWFLSLHLIAVVHNPWLKHILWVAKKKKRGWIFNR